MRQLDSVCLFANMMANRRKTVTFYELSELKKLIEEDWPELYFDCSSDAVLFDVERFSSFFHWENDYTIAYKVKPNCLWVNKYINGALPDCCRSDVLRRIRQYCQLRSIVG